MLRKIWGTIEREHLIKADELVVTGVSGGADSICLLLAFLELKEQLKFRTAAVHVHHGIRGDEADRDEAFVRDFCRSRDVPLLVYHRNVPKLAEKRGLSLEEAGREARYACFREALRELSGNRLAVAHNREDNAETVLFHLFRGSGLKGLSGMDYQAPLPFGRPDDLEDRGRFTLIRPLLDVSRKEIEAYLGERRIPFCRDSTNRSEEYSRNRIRLSILPEAKKINEEAAANIVRAAGMLKGTARFLDAQAGSWLKERAEVSGQELRLPGGALLETGEVLSGLIVRKALDQFTGSLKDIARRHIDEVLRLAEKRTGRKFSLPGGVKVRNEYGMLVFSVDMVSEERASEERGMDPSQEWQETELFGLSFRYRLIKKEPGQKIPENRYTKWFACDKIKGNLSLRGRRPGDWFQAFADGGRQTVKAYMINEKIPQGDRGRIPLLTEGSHVLWIVGGRISEAYKVTEECCRVLEVRVSGMQQ